MAKIIALHFSEVIVPTNPGRVESLGMGKPLHMIPSKGDSAWSRQFDEFPKLILKLELENGVIGLGEFYRDHNIETVQNITSSLLGVDIEQIPLQKLPIGYFREYDGFECAIWDAYARCHKMQVADLLGGAVNDKVKVTSWSSHRHLKEVGKIAQEFQKQGYDCIKFKCDLDDDTISWAEEIRKHAPGMKVIFDPNQRWENLGECKSLFRELEKVGNIFCLEDPLPHWMLSDYAALREFTSIRIVRHVSLPYVYNGQRIHDLINIFYHRCADGFNFNGGAAQIKRMADIAMVANMYFWHGSEVDLGILEAMYVHQAAASENCIWPSDIFGRLIRSHDLLKQPLTLKPPYVYLPTGNGLGIELDEKAMEKYTVKKWSAK